MGVIRGFSAPASLWLPQLLEDLGPIDLDGIHWVIVGGESGAGARPMEKEWVVSIRDQCQRAGVAFFFKQWGGVRKSKAGRRLDGRTYDAFPDRSEATVAGNEQRAAMLAEVNGWYSAPRPGSQSPAATRTVACPGGS